MQKGGKEVGDRQTVSLIQSLGDGNYSGPKIVASRGRSVYDPSHALSHADQ
jgi:hypothetical protein